MLEKQTSQPDCTTTSNHEPPQRTLTLGSLFDGSGGFPLAGLQAGIVPLFASEIEPFAIRVTTKRLPQMKHLGDIKRLNGAEIPPVDIVTSGFPCTDLSLAGLRTGLSGKHSSLFFEAVRVIQEMRVASHGKYPRYLVFENVPGMYSSHQGEDFRTILESIARIKDPDATIPLPKDRWLRAGEIVGDGWSIAYRTLDAQHFQLAQRRARCYLVADFDSECAGEILFEQGGMHGNLEESAEAQKRDAAGATGGFGAAAGLEPGAAGRLGGHAWDELAGTLRADCGDNAASVAAVMCASVEHHPQDSRILLREDGLVQTLHKHMGTGGNNVPLAMVICSEKSNGMQSDNPKVGFYEAATSKTLDANGGNPGCAQGGLCVVAIQGSQIGRDEANGPQGSGVNVDVCFTLNTVDHHAVAIPINLQVATRGNKLGEGTGFGVGHDGDPAYTLQASHSHAIATDIHQQGDPQEITSSADDASSTYCMTVGCHGSVSEDVAHTLMARDFKEPPIVGLPHEPRYIVRRLMAIECALLQGFPIDWCSNLETPEPTEADIDEWAQVFETQRLALGKTTKPRSRNQVRKWLMNPYSEAAEYRLFGNGIALPCGVFVLGRIAAFHASQDHQNTELPPTPCPSAG